MHSENLVLIKRRLTSPQPNKVEQNSDFILTDNDSSKQVIEDYKVVDTQTYKS